MGNCQAIDNATLLIQHPGGRVDKLYCPVTASEIMKMNPGHYVALLLTTTYCPHPPTSTATPSATPDNNNNVPVRITRIKLLRPTDTLALGHVYRLITSQEVMKGLKAKKYAKTKHHHHQGLAENQQKPDKLENLDFEQIIARRSVEKNQVKHDRHRVRVAPPAAAAAKPRAWQPALQSISEAGSLAESH